MNTFILDLDHTLNAIYHPDSYVVKIPLETAQLLSTALREHGSDAPYKTTHKNHPASIWARHNKANFEWLCDYGIALCEEYTFRYGKVHKCQAVIDTCREGSGILSDGEKTTNPLCMPDDVKGDDVVTSYRNYMIKYKTHLKKFKIRSVPFWWE